MGKEVNMPAPEGSPLDESFLLNMIKIVREHPPAKAAVMIQQIFDGIYNDVPEKVECSKGCSHCCYSRVTLTELEMKALASHVRHRFSEAEVVLVMSAAKALKKKYQSMTKEERIMSRDPCPLLLEGQCSVYESRPLMCRSAYSTSAEACRIANEDPLFPVPILIGPKNYASEMIAAILIGEKKKEYELTILDGLLNTFK